jgi:autotransporter-associated beta strand protein
MMGIWPMVHSFKESMPCKMRSKYFFRQLVSAVIIFLFCASPAWAAVYTWTGASSLNWNDAGNWTPAGGPPGPADDIIIENQDLILLTQSEAVNSITITGDNNYLAISGAAGLNYTVTSNNVTATGANNKLISSEAGYGIIITGQLSYGASDLWLTGTGYIQIQGTNSIVGTGAVSIGDHLRLELSGNQTFNYIEDLGGTADTVIALSNSCTLGLNVASGTEYFEGVIQGDGNLRKLGTGDLVLYGLNTYTGSTTVSAGVLGAIDMGPDDDQLPDTTDLIISAGAMCVVDGQFLASLSGSGTLHIMDFGVLLWGPGNHTFNGSITEEVFDSTEFYFTGNGTFTVNGILAPYTEVWGGSLVLNGTAQNYLLVFVGNLSGTGTVLGPLEIYGSVFNPGNSIGTFNLDFAIGLGPDSRLFIEVNGTVCDQVIVKTYVDILDCYLDVKGVPIKGSELTIIECGGAEPVLGTFVGLPEGVEFESGGYKYKITYVGGDGNDVVLTALTGGDPGPVPPAKPKITQGASPNPTTSLNGPVLSWPKVKNADSYLIYRAECPTCTRSQISQIKASSFVGSSLTINEDYVSFVDSSALAGQPYYYWVRAENEAGMSGYSNWMVAWRYEQNPGRAGDFNGDGVMDLLWWYPDSNLIQAWFLRGGEVWSLSPQGQGLDISQWLLMGTGDFNGDGLCDLVWWKPETGEVQFWYKPFGQQPMPRSAGITKTEASLDNMTGNGTMADTGDINGDGITDILWRDYATGQVTLWLMGEDGKPQLNGPPTPASPGIVSGDRPGAYGGLDWQAGGLADANGNGKADVFWRNAKDNRVITWFMDGSVITDLAEENKGLDLAWRLRGLGDLNGDNLADIAWRNQDSGEVKAWLMSSGIFNEERTVLEGSSDALKWQSNAVADFCGKQCDDVYCKNSDNGAALIMSLDGEVHRPSAK